MRSASLAACVVCLSTIVGIAGATRATAQSGINQAQEAAGISRALAARAIAHYAVADCDYDLWTEAVEDLRLAGYRLGASKQSELGVGPAFSHGGPYTSQGDRIWHEMNRTWPLYPFPCTRRTTTAVPQQKAPAVGTKSHARAGSAIRPKGGTAKGPKGELAVPGLTTPGLAFNFGLDALRWCTYGGGSGFPTIAIPTDDNGTPLFPGGTFINEPPTWPVPLTVSPPWGGDVTITDLPKGPTIIETPFGPPRIVTPPPGSTPPSGPPSPPETPVAAPPSSPPAGKPPETPTAGPPSQPPTGKPPETPTAGPPSTPPVSTPRETPIIIFVKATQSVLEGQPQGTGLPGYNTAVFPPFKPDLPFTNGSTQTAQQDVGFDKDPVKCTTGQGGECKLELDVGTQQEFGIQPTGGTALNLNNFRVDVSVPQTSGAVIEITGLGGDDVIKLDDLRSGLPNQINILPEPFNIGRRSFLRLSFNQPFGVTFDPVAHLAKQSSIGARPVTLATDFCRDKQPGPPLGVQPASYSAVNRALPEATIRLQQPVIDRLRR
jgi:cell division septation protein DedD